jgi:hypothetical protein
MAWEAEVRYCEGCGAEISGAPVLQDGRQYCCQDCAEGRECECGLVFEDDRREGAGGPAEAAL